MKLDIRLKLHTENAHILKGLLIDIPVTPTATGYKFNVSPDNLLQLLERLQRTRYLFDGKDANHEIYLVFSEEE